MGKSTFVDYAFVIQPYLDSLLNNTSVEWIYYSFELGRVTKEFDFATYFLYHDFGITEITLDEGITYTTLKQTSNKVKLSPDYLRGRLQDDNGNIIKVNDSIIDCLKKVYKNRIVPLFGKYDEFGNQLEKGVITFIETKNNPTGFYKDWIKYAETQGKVTRKKYGETMRIVNFIPNNPDKNVIIVFDHIRKISLERGFLMKQAVDKLLEYMVEIRDLCNFTFVPIVHTNRSVSDIDMMKHSGDELFPNEDSIKDSGNMCEDCDYLFTIFNPNDDKFRLLKHFGLTLKDSRGNPMFPDLRTLHLVSSRHCFFPQHFRTNMKGGLKSFEQIKNIQ